MYIKNFKYKNSRGTVKFDKTKKVYYGRVTKIKNHVLMDLLEYEAIEIEDLKRKFITIVENKLHKY